MIQETSFDVAPHLDTGNTHMYDIERRLTQAAAIKFERKVAHNCIKEEEVPGETLVYNERVVKERRR